ncbi:CENP-S complex- centromere protein X [Apiospora phragmitis]|uniref:CENP-S complex- centromere protein X n=1 Tax=Apiospora phragmitis TaxID=2905665 RepID=A0ABR1WTC4_9PEZI
MPPTNPYKAPRPRGRPAGSTAGSSSASKSTKAPAAKRAAAQNNESDTDPFADSQQDPSRDDVMEVEDDEEDDDDEEPAKTIPPELLTRILHTCFEKEGTRISKDANKAVAQYMDIFVRESIARVALEKEAGFLEVRCVDGSLPFLAHFFTTPIELTFTN